MKVVVIVVGINGLTFAAAMQHFSPQTQVEVYERDQSQASLPHGSFLM